MQGIEIPIGAPLGKLNQDLDGAQKALKGFTVATNGDLLSIGKSLGTLERQLKVFKDGIKNSTDPGRILLLNNAIKATEAQLVGTKNAINGVGFNKFSTGSNQAAFALTNLGRVAQDAPFGFIGIQNNLNPLLESFQQLKAQSGSSSAALKLLGQSLIGPAGLGIALSLVTAAITFYTQYQQKANKTTNDTKKAADEYITTLGQLQQAQLKGATSAQEELTTLSLLFNEYKDQNSPLQNRKAAYEELQKLYPAYFKNLDFESNAAGKTKTAYDLLTTSILANARAKAASDLITKNVTRQLENEIKLINLGIAANKKKSEADKIASDRAKKSGGDVGDIENTNTAATRKEISALNDLADINKQIANIVTDTLLLNEKNLQLTKSVTDEKSKIDPKFNDEIDKSNKSIKTQSDILKALSLDFKQIASDFSITFGKGNEERVTALKKAINDLISIGFTADSSIIKRLQTQLLAIDPDQIKAQGKEVGVTAALGIGEGLAATAPVIAKDFSNSLKLPLTDFQIYVNEQLLPKLQTNFETFFNDILMNGKLSFDSLGKALINTLLSVVASDAARQITSLLKTSSGKDFTDSKKDGGGGILGAAFGLLKLGKKAAPVVTTAATTTAATTTAALAPAAAASPLLPILAGVAAVALVANLFKKKQQAPIPQASSTISTSAAGSAQDFGGGRVVFEISGTNLIGVLNRAGAKLQRFGP